MLIIVLEEQNLNKTLQALKNQTVKDFKIVCAKDIETPLGINNTINAIVTKYDSDYYSVLTAGCLPWTNWANNIKHYNADFIVGPVHLTSRNQQPKWLCRPESLKYGDCYSIETANYNNFSFSKEAYWKHGGFNANEDTLKYFINQFNGVYLPYNFVEKIVEFNTEDKGDYYRYNTSRPGTLVQWKPIYHERTFPKKPNLLITIATGKLAKEVLFYTEESHFKYADKINADYIQLTDETQEWWGLEKFRLYNQFNNYNRVLFLDCDIIIKDNAPNIFEEVPEGYIGVVNDWDGNGDGTLKTNYWIRQEAKEMSYYQKREYIPSEIYNSGVVVFNGNQSDIWEPPKYPFTYFHCTEQHWVEQNIRHKRYPVYILDKKWNLQYWRQDYQENEKDAYFLHPAGEVDKLGFVYSKFNQNKSKIQDGQITTLNYKKIPFTKKQSRAIVTVCSDNSKLLEKTSKSHSFYAEKVDADYHIIRENINPHWGMGNKYLIKNFTEKYDKTLYIDSDVYIRRSSPDIFELTPNDQIGIHNETEELKDIQYEKHIQNVHNHICEFLGFETQKVFSLNCGVMVIPKSMSGLYTNPTEEFPAYWCFDQHYLLCLLRQYKMDYFEIGEKFNWEYIRKDWFEGLNNAWFIHLNGLKSETKRLKLLELV